jgi:Glycosyl transferase family 11
VITVSVFGGLGNQMFQYAAGKALAERHGVPLALDLGGFRAYPTRTYLLDRLQIPEAAVRALPTQEQEGIAGHFARERWGARVDRLMAYAGLALPRSSRNSYRERHFHFDPLFETLGPDARLFGYFQSERYFCSIATRLRDYFAPREPFPKPARMTAERILGSKMPVSVHVRRGDYLQAATSATHGLLGEDYYRAALTRMEEILGEPFDLFVFSDDAAAAAEVLRFVRPDRITHVRGDPKRPWEDMALMARCRHHVIANSSFSWWGAWLNQAPDKKVIVPRLWFTSKTLRTRDTRDLYPLGWIQL